MRTEAKCIALLLLFLAYPAASAADFANGRDALDRGDYGAALKEIKLLAEGGNAGAQKLLDSVAKLMTSAQIDQARQKADQYRQKYVVRFRHY